MGEFKIKGSGKTVRCFVVQYVERVYRSVSLKWISCNIVLGKGSMKYELRFDVGWSWQGASREEIRVEGVKRGPVF